MFSPSRASSTIAKIISLNLVPPISKDTLTGCFVLIGCEDPDPGCTAPCGEDWKLAAGEETDPFAATGKPVPDFA